MRKMYSEQQIGDIAIKESEKVSIESFGSLFNTIEKAYPMHIIDATEYWESVIIANEDPKTYSDHELTEEELKEHKFNVSWNDSDVMSVTATIEFPNTVNSQEEFVDYVDNGGELIITKVEGSTWDDGVTKTVLVGTNLKLYYSGESPEDFKWEGSYAFKGTDDLTLEDTDIRLEGPAYFDYGNYNMSADNLNILYGTSSARISDIYAKKIDINSINGSDGSKAVLGVRGSEISLPNNAIGSIWIRNYNGTSLFITKNWAQLATNNNQGFRVLNDGSVLVQGLPTTDPQVENQLWNDNGVLKISAGE